ncbi:MAG: hypothetical protein DME65_14980 [Verrucomicrobia bacterium]|nr:MAG: hypothetical protein DME65_14980 [Verrucomicrobiota bacterium]
MSQQSDMAEKVYDRLTRSDVSSAELVEELRANWAPEHGAMGSALVLSVRLQLVVGDSRDSHFTGWGLKPWEAHAKVEQELLSMDTFLYDKEHCVFHRPRQT